MILCVLSSGGGQLFAASREGNAYAAAVAQFHDGFWSRAETLLAQFVINYRTSTNVPMAILLQAQAEFKQGKFFEAAALLTTNQAAAGHLADEYVRWVGEAQFTNGDYAAAADTFTRLVATFPDSPLSLTAVIGAAAANEKLGESGWARLDGLLAATNGVFARWAQLDPGSPQVVAGRLLLAQAKFLRDDFTGADAILDLLDSQLLRPEQDFQRWRLRCRIKIARQDLAAALAATVNLLQIARLQNNAVRLAESVALRGDLLEKLNRLPEAIQVWKDNLTNAPEERVKEALLKLAALAVVQGDFSAAEAMLEQFRMQFPESAQASLTLLTTGELQLRKYIAQPAATNQLALAMGSFDQFLTAATNGPLAGRAFLDRGWSRWLAGNTNDSLADFLAAVGRLPVSADLAVAKFKAGDGLLVQGDYLAARGYYQSVLADFSGFPAVAQSLGGRALYQVLQANLKLNDLAGAEAAMRQLLEKFPGSELRANSLLLVGEANSDLHQPAKALKLFQDFEKQFPDSPLRPRVAMAAARTFERMGDWAVAITNYEGWRKTYPTNELLPQVEFALAEAQFHAGNETNAFVLFTAFITEFPTDPLAPLAQWWVADHYFRATNFAGVENFLAAETNYENIFQNLAWKNSEVYYPAQLMAGRAAMARLGFADAVRSYFMPLLSDTNCPADIVVPTRFACAHALMQAEVADTNKLAANYQSALALLALVYQLNSTNEWAARAWSEIGDYNLQMGDFTAATNAYARVLEFSAADHGLRDRARVGLGLTLEKAAALLPPVDQKPLLKSALDHYCDVLYDQTADAFWAKKAGLQALPLAQTTGEGDIESVIKGLEILLPQLKDLLEKKKAALKINR